MLPLHKMNNYRIKTKEQFQESLESPVWILGLDTDLEALTVHHPDCSHLKRSANNPDLKGHPKFAVPRSQFQQFCQDAKRYGIPITCRCGSKSCREGREPYNLS